MKSIVNLIYEHQERSVYHVYSLIISRRAVEYRRLAMHERGCLMQSDVKARGGTAREVCHRRFESEVCLNKNGQQAPLI